MVNAHVSIKLCRLTSIAAAALAVSAGAASAEDVRPPAGQRPAVEVGAPGTRVEVDQRSGATDVTVRAPHTAVDVDTRAREVRIRVPYFRGDIRW